MPGLFGFSGCVLAVTLGLYSSWEGKSTGEVRSSTGLKLWLPSPRRTCPALSGWGNRFWSRAQASPLQNVHHLLFQGRGPLDSDKDIPSLTGPTVLGAGGWTGWWGEIVQRKFYLDNLRQGVPHEIGSLWNGPCIKTPPAPPPWTWFCEPSWPRPRSHPKVASVTHCNGDNSQLTNLWCCKGEKSRIQGTGSFLP